MRRIRERDFVTGVRISGVGTTRFESASDRSVLELAADAAERALADAELAGSDVTSLHVGNALAIQTGLANALSSTLGFDGVRADRVENTSATGASAVHRGIDAVASGGSAVALVVGVEKMSAGNTSNVTETISRLVHDREYEQGLTLPSFGGLAARAYLERYDAPREALATVAEKNHRNAADNSIAQFQTQISVSEALESPIVADPLRLYDCCPMTDGAAAMVLSTTGDVHVAGAASATGTHAVAERDDLLELESVRTAGQRAFDRAGVTPRDVDVACLHDAFTVLELLELEELGFYDRGTAWEATMAGETRLDGDCPVNPGGGLKARGHPLGASGIAQLVELTWQVRGDLPPARQVPGARTGFAINVAGFGNNSVCTVIES